MTKQVSLSDHAYQRLRRARLQGESFSNVVERLVDRQSKEPLHFAQRMAGLEWDGTPAKRAARIEAEREATRGPV